MHCTLSKGYLLQSFDEQEAFSFGGLWKCRYKLNGKEIPGEYLLEDVVTTNERYCGLIKIEILGKWRSDIRFSITLIDTDTKQIIRPLQHYPKLSLFGTTNEAVLFHQQFLKGEASTIESLEISSANFISINTWE